MLQSHRMLPCCKHRMKPIKENEPSNRHKGHDDTIIPHRMYVDWMSHTIDGSSCSHQASGGMSTFAPTPVIKGQGNSSTVFEYDEQGCALIPSVLRVRKRSWFSSSTSSQAQELERAVWQDLIENVGDLDSLESDLYYVNKIIGPMIGLQYIPQQVRIGLMSCRLCHDCQCFCCNSLLS